MNNTCALLFAVPTKRKLSCNLSSTPSPPLHAHSIISPRSRWLGRFQEFRDELRDLPLGPGGSLQRLSSMAQYLFDREKPNLNYQTPAKKGTGIISNVRGKMTKLLGPLQVCV